ncbi:MarR family transcriptional regulator [Streptomyces sp. Root66D1]|nr:MarR family transcriptional regulator [Streptomyces sp. Root1304]KRA84869.1 MarR family transcriptional regulator [Streptomyces sp. Root66D1]
MDLRGQYAAGPSEDMVAIVNDLQSGGLVSRTPDPADRRKNAITVSASGKERLRRTERLGDEANDELTAALTPLERDQLIDLLTRIAHPKEPCGGAGETP